MMGTGYLLVEPGISLAKKLSVLGLTELTLHVTVSKAEESVTFRVYSSCSVEWSSDRSLVAGRLLITGGCVYRKIAQHHWTKKVKPVFIFLILLSTRQYFFLYKDQ